MRLIDADELLKEIEELKKSPWFNNGRGGCVLHGLYLERKEAVEIVEDICIKKAPTIKTFTLADIEEQYRKGLEKGLEEAEQKKCPIFSDDEVKQPCIKSPCGFERPLCDICGSRNKKEGEANV